MSMYVLVLVIGIVQIRGYNSALEANVVCNYNVLTLQKLEVYTWWNDPVKCFDKILEYEES